MNEALKQELTGRPPVLVSLGGRDYPLEFSIHAVILYKQLTGDNLFDGKCWSKIAPLEDPERFTACLWAGLHEFADGKWTAPLTRSQIEKLIDFTNVTPTCESVAKALASYFPKVQNDEAASPGETPLPASANVSSTETSASPSSGPLLVSTSA
jgi:hypothetical protein